ncbi:response regulator [Bradyrhizobium sp. 183]|uniref:hybrid sensor histidine kinase/response regulator n=1 Tax=unclassified Bradyrhizobium TaxID=2631580 RepID=UPI001FFF6CC5|nr:MULTISPECIES: hybrid sensor histidine kinase/response regulator [unclassified Bradyrhizobium]UPJ79776.1 response regulator [Bradyrhizobium sp. 184]UPJ87571.1 response regulator [Bradyrhizobium sp. 183]
MAKSETFAQRTESGAAARTLLAALETVGYGIALWSSDGKFVWSNRAYRDFFHQASPALTEGVTLESFLTTLVTSGDIIAPPNTDVWIRTSVRDFGIGERADLLLADGRTLELAQDSAVEGSVVMTVTDITAIRGTEKALRRSKEIAEAADQSKSRFLRAASHDLRQPLASLKILIFNCVDETDAEQRSQILHAMDVSVSIMEDLLNALLQIGQIDAGRITPNITTFQLSQLFDRLKVQFGQLARDKGLQLRIVGTSSTVKSDRALLERILSNLLSNSIRYTKSGCVLIGCRRSSNGLRLEVRDTGIGIDGPHLDRIFDEFYQVPVPREGKNRGLGLGLSIVKRLADILGHKLSVRSTLGKGSVFAIDLPPGDVRQSELGESAISERIGGEFVERFVLLIEDDESLREAARDLLERWGIEVHSAVDLETARVLLDKVGKSPHLIISDYSLRGERGTDVVDAIRSHLGRAVPAIIMTADTDPTLMTQLAQRSFPVLVKPVSPPRLRVLMHNLLYEPSGPPE